LRAYVARLQQKRYEASEARCACNRHQGVFRREMSAKQIQFW